MKKILILLAMSLCGHAMAQAPAIQWQKSLGGPGRDYPGDVQQTTDGGYIVCGATSSSSGDVSSNAGAYDMWVVKLSAAGSIEWQKSYGGSKDDGAAIIRQTADGGYIAAGSTNSTNGDVTGRTDTVNPDVWLVKLSATGAIQWQRSFGSSDTDYVYELEQTADGNYIAVGSAGQADGDVTFIHGMNDIWLIRISATGGLLWQKTYGSTLDDMGYDVSLTADGGYIITGGVNAGDGDVSGYHGDRDAWVAKLDSGGAITWQSAYGGSASDVTRTIKQCSDGGYVVAGHSISTDGDISDARGGTDFWALKLTATGSIEWHRNMGSTGGDYQHSVSEQTVDGGFILIGITTRNDGDVHGFNSFGDSWLAKLTAEGELGWQKCFGGSAIDEGCRIVSTTDGGFIMLSRSESNDGDVSGNHGLSDWWVVKLGPELTAVQDVVAPVVAVAPNPATDKITVTGIDQASVYVYTMLGQQVAASATPSLSIATLPVGVYLVKALDKDGNPVYAGRVVKVGE